MLNLSKYLWHHILHSWMWLDSTNQYAGNKSTILSTRYALFFSSCQVLYMLFLPISCKYIVLINPYIVVYRHLCDLRTHWWIYFKKPYITYSLNNQKYVSRVSTNFCQSISPGVSRWCMTPHLIWFSQNRRNEISGVSSWGMKPDYPASFIFMIPGGNLWGSSGNRKTQHYPWHEFNESCWYLYAIGSWW